MWDEVFNITVYFAVLVYQGPFGSNLLYEQKYKAVNFDVIITTDDNALRFVQKYHKDLFHETPVCFCGINDYKPALLKGKEQFTGVLEILGKKLILVNGSLFFYV